MLKQLTVGFMLFGATGCSKSDPSIARTTASAQIGNPSTEAPIQPKLTAESFGEVPAKFESVEAELDYWQRRVIDDVKKRFASLTEADIQKEFDNLEPHIKASVQRIKTWLPHKRISEMGNAGNDVIILTSFPKQFDAEIALRRLLEFGDDSGAPELIRKLGVKAPRAIVGFRMDFGQIGPDTQALVWGINQKLRSGGSTKLSPSEFALVQSRPALFPAP